MTAIVGLHYVRRTVGGKPTWYVYAYRGGPRIMVATGLRKPALTPAAIDAYEGSRRSYSMSSLTALIADYRKSHHWRTIAEGTRRTWQPILDKIEARWGVTPIKVWSDPRMVVKIIAWRDEAASTPRAADNRVAVLRTLLEWARLEGRVTTNVARAIPQIYRGGNRADIIWTDEDRAAFAKAAKVSPHMVNALDLACATGLRVADLAALTWGEVGEHAIVRLALKASKGKRRTATIPITPTLRAVLDRLRRADAGPDDRVLLNGKGQPWSSASLTARFVTFRNRAGIVHSDGRPKHLHDARGTFATVLMRAGLTDQEIGRVLGWSPERVGRIRSTYIDDAQTVIEIGRRIEAAVKRGVK